MKILDALKLLNSGQKIRLPWWQKENYLIYDSIQSKFLMKPSNTPYDFLFLIKNHDEMDLELYNDSTKFSDLSYGDKFRWTENGPIMQKVHLDFGITGYMNTTTFNCSAISTMNNVNKVYKV